MNHGSEQGLKIRKKISTCENNNKNQKLTRKIQFPSVFTLKWDFIFSISLEERMTSTALDASIISAVLANI